MDKDIAVQLQKIESKIDHICELLDTQTRRINDHSEEIDDLRVKVSSLQAMRDTDWSHIRLYMAGLTVIAGLVAALISKFL